MLPPEEGLKVGGLSAVLGGDPDAVELHHLKRAAEPSLKAFADLTDSMRPPTTSLRERAFMDGVFRNFGQRVASLPQHVKHAEVHMLPDEAAATAASWEVGKLKQAVERGVFRYPGSQRFAGVWQELLERPGSLIPRTDEVEEFVRQAEGFARATGDTVRPELFGVDLTPKGVRTVYRFDRTAPIATVLHEVSDGPVGPSSSPLPKGEAHPGGFFVAVEPDGTTAVYAEPTPETHDELRSLRPLGLDSDDVRGVYRYVPLKARAVADARETTDSLLALPGPKATVETHADPFSSELAYRPGNRIVVRVDLETEGVLDALEKELELGPLERFRGVRRHDRVGEDTTVRNQAGAVIELGDAPERDEVVRLLRKIDHVSTATKSELVRKAYLHDPGVLPGGWARVVEHHYVGTPGQGTIVHQGADHDLASENAVPVYVPRADADYEPTGDDRFKSRRSRYVPTATPDGEYVLDGEVRVVVDPEVAPRFSLTDRNVLRSRIGTGDVRHLAVAFGEGLPVVGVGSTADSAVRRAGLGAVRIEVGTTRNGAKGVRVFAPALGDEVDARAAWETVALLRRLGAPLRPGQYSFHRNDTGEEVAL